MKNFQSFLTEKKTIDVDTALYVAKGKGGMFVVMARDTAGMKGKQDKFSMYVVADSKGVVKKDLGSHPSLKGAKGFGKKRGFDDQQTEVIDPYKNSKFISVKESDAISMKQTSRIAKDWAKIAGEKVEIEDVKGTIYAYGSELATLKLLFKFTNGGQNNPGGKFKADYSKNLKKHFFRLER